MNPSQTLLVTGGTGSFGKMILRQLIKLPRDEVPKRIVILSRDEDKQYSQRQELSDDRLEYVVGDIRDIETCHAVMKGVTIVIHAAALKQVPTGEYFPGEVVRTNILGTENLVRAAEMHGVSKFVILSTDKAVYPINAYGMSKALAEKILMAMVVRNSNSGHGTVYCIVRSGNVMGSRGSVIPLFLKQIEEKGEVTVTDPQMTRFMLKLERATSLFRHVIEEGKQGRLYIKKAPACTVEILIQALELHFGRKIKRRVIGVRPGEKIHETLLTVDEIARSDEEKDAFDGEPITSVRSYFECSMYNGLDLASTERLDKPLPLCRDFTSQDAEQLGAQETLALLREAMLL